MTPYFSDIRWRETVIIPTAREYAAEGRLDALIEANGFNLEQEAILRASL